MSQLFVLNCNSTVAVDANGNPETVFGGLKYLWLVGVGCSVFSSLATALGTILQKKAHNIQEALPDDQKSFELIGIVFNKYWMFALFIMVLIPLPFDFAAFALAPQSVIVPMTGLTIVLNQAFAPKLLGEKLTHVEFIGTAIILVGVVVIAVTAGGNPTEYNVCQLVARYKDPDVLGMVFTILGLVSICLFWVHTHRHPAALEKLRPEMYAFIAGGLGGLMNVAFKATGELVKGEVGPAQTDTWATIWPYFHVLAVAVLAIGMISYINRGLQVYDAILFTPLYFTNLIVCSTSLGLIYYKEYTKFETWQAVVFPIGLLVVCGGVLFMSVKGVDLSKVRLRAKRLELSRENRRSMAASSRTNGSARTLGPLGSRARGAGSQSSHGSHGSHRSADSHTASVASGSARTLDPDAGSVDGSGGGGGSARSLGAGGAAALAGAAGNLRDAMRRGVGSLRAPEMPSIGVPDAVRSRLATMRVPAVLRPMSTREIPLSRNGSVLPDKDLDAAAGAPADVMGASVDLDLERGATGDEDEEDEDEDEEVDLQHMRQVQRTEQEEQENVRRASRKSSRRSQAQADEDRRSSGSSSSRSKPADSM